MEFQFHFWRKEVNYFLLEAMQQSLSHLVVAKCILCHQNKT